MQSTSRPTVYAEGLYTWPTHAHFEDDCGFNKANEIDCISLISPMGIGKHQTGFSIAVSLTNHNTNKSEAEATSAMTAQHQINIRSVFNPLPSGFYDHICLISALFLFDMFYNEETYRIAHYECMNKPDKAVASCLISIEWYMGFEDKQTHLGTNTCYKLRIIMCQYENICTTRPGDTWTV